MEWLSDLFTKDSVAHAVLIYGLVIAIGVTLGKVKILNISLGITWVLFVGIIASHFHLLINKEVEHFAREFGLILFVYSIGLQVGPGFLSSLKKQGLSLNLLAAAVVLTGAIVTVAIHYATGTPIAVMAGIMSGAVTNTPGLGAAQQALADLKASGIDLAIPNLGLGYAVAYPFGVIGIILSLIFFRYAFKVDLLAEKALHKERLLKDVPAPSTINLEVENPKLFNQPLRIIKSIINTKLVISRIYHDGEITTPDSETILHENDIILAVAPKEDFEKLKILVGKESEVDLIKIKSNIISRRIVVTKDEVTHKTIGEQRFINSQDFTITRVSRAGIEFVATTDTVFQIGDIVTVVGREEAVTLFAKVLGNSLKRLDHPNLAPIFFGIVLGVLFGSIPFVVPGIPAPVKIGLAGGPLIVAILMSRFGPKLYLTPYVTQGANLMLREIGIVLFLASVGLSSGEHFVEILVSGDGLTWMLYGMIITLSPLLIVGFLAKVLFKCSYFEICGLLSGASTDPPALAFATHSAGSDAPAITYATVYPLTMILRILMAQMMILVFM
ncbi:putative transporter [Arcticibacter sp. MXS-1]|uniref:putative transporter n=1 Tax=Arcticibacter sp. MXS-1 TaxID=3341726 RepID=UPI0035A87CF7